MLLDRCDTGGAASEALNVAPAQPPHAAVGPLLSACAAPRRPQPLAEMRFGQRARRGWRPRRGDRGGGRGGAPARPRACCIRRVRCRDGDLVVV